MKFDIQQGAVCQKIPPICCR